MTQELRTLTDRNYLIISVFPWPQNLRIIMTTSIYNKEHPPFNCEGHLGNMRVHFYINRGSRKTLNYLFLTVQMLWWAYFPADLTLVDLWHWHFNFDLLRILIVLTKNFNLGYNLNSFQAHLEPSQFVHHHFSRLRLCCTCTLLWLCGTLLQGSR